MFGMILKLKAAAGPKFFDFSTSKIIFKIYTTVLTFGFNIFESPQGNSFSKSKLEDLTLLHTQMKQHSESSKFWRNDKLDLIKFCMQIWNKPMALMLHFKRLRALHRGRWLVKLAYSLNILILKNEIVQMPKYRAFFKKNQMEKLKALWNLLYICIYRGVSSLLLAVMLL